MSSFPGKFSVKFISFDISLLSMDTKIFAAYAGSFLLSYTLSKKFPADFGRLDWLNCNTLKFHFIRISISDTIRYVSWKFIPLNSNMFCSLNISNFHILCDTASKDRGFKLGSFSCCLILLWRYGFCGSHLGAFGQSCPPHWAVEKWMVALKSPKYT